MAKNANASSWNLTVQPDGRCYSSGSPPLTQKFHRGHWVSLPYFVRDDNNGIPNGAFVTNSVGVMTRHYWNNIETAPGIFDFTRLHDDLDRCKNQNRRFICMLADKSFKASINPMPSDITNLAVQHNNNGGWIAVRWNATVLARFQALNAAVLAEFDTDPYFEGIIYEESAPSLSNAALAATTPAYTPERYRDYYTNMLLAANAAATSSRIFAMMNFIPQNQNMLTTILNSVKNTKVLMGGPDLLPNNASLVKLAYPLYTTFDGVMNMHCNAERNSYQETNPMPPPTFSTMESLYQYGLTTLHLDYLFWDYWTAPPQPGANDFADAVAVMLAHPEFDQ